MATKTITPTITPTDTPTDTPTNRNTEPGATIIPLVANDPVFIPWDPKMVLDDKGKLVVAPKVYFEHDGTSWYPIGYDPNTHINLKQTSFKTNALFCAYKALVHIPHYIRKQETRIEGWIDGM